MPLTGLRVLDLSRLLPGPWCTMLLGDLGADVVKVEDPRGGDPTRWGPPLSGDHGAAFWQLNRNKRSVRLDLKTEGGRAAFLRLCRGADVVVESFRPGVMERLGAGWDALHRVNPRLVLCSISGYGQDGPYRERAGHDINYTAVAGVLEATGTRQGEPAIPGAQVADLGGGAMSACIAVLAALAARERTGEGQWCDVSMTDGALAWMGLQVAGLLGGDPAGGPGGGRLAGRHPCYNLYRCADGWLSVGALEAKFWTLLVRTLGLGHLEGSGFAEGAEADRVHAEVEAVLRTDTRAGWAARLDGLDVCVEPVLGLGESLEHVQVRARGMVLDAGVAGPLPQVGFPFRLGATPAKVRRQAPGYGEHTREVLLEAGLTAAEIDELVAEGAAA